MVLEMTSGGSSLWPMPDSKTIASMRSSIDSVQMISLWVAMMGTMSRAILTIRCRSCVPSILFWKSCMERTLLLEDAVVAVVVEHAGVVGGMLVVHLILLRHQLVDVADATSVVHAGNAILDVDGQNVAPFSRH